MFDVTNKNQSNKDESLFVEVDVTRKLRIDHEMRKITALNDGPQLVIIRRRNQLKKNSVK